MRSGVRGPDPLAARHAHGAAMVDADVTRWIDGSDQALADAMEAMARWQRAPAVAVRSDAGLMARGAVRFPTPYNNAVLPLGADPEPDVVIELARRELSDRRHFVWRRAHDDPRLAAALDCSGYTSVGEMPVMVIAAPVTPPEIAPGVQIVQATHRSGIDEAVEVCAASYEEAGLPAGVTARLFANPDAVCSDDTAVIVARLEGRPAACAIAIWNPATGNGGLYWVGTRPGARKRGLGDAVARIATNTALERGARFVSLQASEAGAPIYVRMGYRTVTTLDRHLSPRQ